ILDGLHLPRRQLRRALVADAALPVALHLKTIDEALLLLLRNYMQRADRLWRSIANYANRQLVARDVFLDNHWLTIRPPVGAYEIRELRGRIDDALAAHSLARPLPRRLHDTRVREGAARCDRLKIVVRFARGACGRLDPGGEDECFRRMLV